MSICYILNIFTCLLLLTTTRASLDEPFMRRLVARHEFCSREIITEKDVKTFESCSSKFNLHEAIAIQCLQSLVTDPLTREAMMCQRASVSQEWNEKFMNCTIEERKRVCLQPPTNEVSQPNTDAQPTNCQLLQNHKFNESNECLENAFNITIEREFYDWIKKSAQNVGVTRIRYCDAAAKFSNKSLKEALKCTKFHGIIDKRYADECDEEFWKSIKNSNQLTLNQRRIIFCNNIKASNSYETHMLMCAARKMKFLDDSLMKKLSVTATHQVWKTSIGNKAHPIDEYRHRMHLLLNRRDCLEGTLKEKKPRDPTIIGDSDDE